MSIRSNKNIGNYDKQTRNYLSEEEEYNKLLLKNQQPLKKVTPILFSSNSSINNLDTLNKKILNSSIIDNEMLMLNQKIGLASNQEGFNNVVKRNLTKQEQELLTDYIEEHPQNYEYQSTEIDPITGKEHIITKYRKYMPANNFPNLEEPNIDQLNALDNYKKEIEEIKYDINNLSHQIKQKTNELQNAEKNYSKITQIFNDHGFLEEERLDVEIMFNNSAKVCNKLRNELNELDSEAYKLYRKLDFATQNFNDLNKQIQIINQNNLEKANSYRDELNLLNKGAFSTEKELNETEQQYLERLRMNSEIDTPENELFNAKQFIYKKFKDIMREIIKNPIIIEQVSNQLDNLAHNDVSNKREVIKKFPLIKKLFLETYGYNPQLQSDEIINFFYNVLHNNITKNREGEQLKTEELKHKIYNLKFYINTDDKTLDIVDTQTNMPVVKFCYQIVQKSKFHLYYTFDIKRENPEWVRFYTYSKDNLPPSKNIISNKIGIKIYEFCDFLGIDAFTPNSIIEKFRNELRPNDIKPFAPTMELKKGVGINSYNIDSHDYPEFVKFGEHYLNLKKLHQYNLVVLKNKRNASVDGFPNIKVSNLFSNLLFSLIVNKKIPTHQDINNLFGSEKELWDVLISSAGLKKKFVNESDSTIKKYKHKLSVLEGEIEAGQNNPEVFKQIKSILQKLYHLKVINSNQMREHLNHLKTFN
jgi:hypothetical protein